jgi:DNA modification methylase
MPRAYRNRLNDLDSKSWLKFQKSWFVHNPPARRKDVIRHPAKFPESLAQEFIEFFTQRGGVVLDPMAGTGSALVAAMRAGRNSYGIELSSDYAQIAQQVIDEERANLGDLAAGLTTKIIQGDAAKIGTLAAQAAMPAVDYMITSPPYWNMLRAAGAETQKKRRQAPGLDVFYSDHPDDLGNIEDYDEFVERLVSIYTAIKPFLRQNAYLTIIVKNVKKGGQVYPLAWDLARRLSQAYRLKDEKIWCQDDIRLAPYGLGSAWVSNTFHHYCLQFRNE